MSGNGNHGDFSISRCNGLLPIWGPNVPETVFSSSLARHNHYLSEATNHRDIGYQSTVHDIKLLLLRFAEVFALFIQEFLLLYSILNSDH